MKMGGGGVQTVVRRTGHEAYKYEQRSVSSFSLHHNFTQTNIWSDIQWLLGANFIGEKPAGSQN
jgi:hypothetical protein